MMVFSISVTSLPENVTLQIFSYLSIAERCQIARVCRLWSQLIRDKYLWQYVDLSPYQIPPKTLWKVVRGYFSDSLRSLTLHGFLNSIKKTECLSHALLEELASRCPKLSNMRIINANLCMIKSNRFPLNLKRLHIERCEINPHWLQKAMQEKCFEILEELSFSSSKRFSDIDIVHVCKISNLKLLNLNSCYRISDDAVNELTDLLTKLETLILSGCSITDLSLHFISHKLKNIKMLDVSNCTSITNAGLRILGMPYCPNILKVKCCELLSTRELAIVVKRNPGLVTVEFSNGDEVKLLTRTNISEYLGESEEKRDQEI